MAIDNRGRFNITVQDAYGNIKPNATVEIRTETALTLTSLFSDRDGLVSLANPITADANGYAFAYAEAGLYQVKIIVDGRTTIWRDVEIGTAGTGSAGADGVSGGIPFNFDDNTTTAADPGNGEFRLNNATFASATEISLNYNSAATGNPSVEALLKTWDDSTNTALYGHLLIKKASAPENFVSLAITSVITDGGTYGRFTVSHVDSAGTLAASDACTIEFSRTGNVGGQGNPGTNGTNGTDGITPGTVHNFDVSTTTNADPGSGDLRFNNATFASITELAINYTGAATGTPDLETLIKSWDDSTSSSNRGTLTIKKASAPENFVVLRITSAITDGTTYGRFTVEYMAGGGSFSDTDELVVEFSRTGNVGAAGAGSGDMIAANNLSDLVNLTTARSNLGVEIGADVQAHSPVLAGTTASYTTTEETKLAGIDANADVTGATNVTAAGALMDSEVSSLTGIKTLTVPNSTTISTFGATLTAAASAAAARTLLALGTIATLAETTVAEWRGNTADRALSTDQVWSAMAEETLTDAANIAFNMSAGFDFVLTLGGNRTLDNPTNAKVGQRGRIRVVQDGTGTRLISAYGTSYEFAGGTAPTLSTGAGDEDILYYDVISSTRILITSVLDIS